VLFATAVQDALKSLIAKEFAKIQGLDLDGHGMGRRNGYWQTW